MSSEKNWKIFLGPILLLVVSFLIYLLRYPLWWAIIFVEQIFVMLILSYGAVLILALFLLKYDSKSSLILFKKTRYVWVLVGLIFALLYLGLWYLFSFVLGSRFEITAFPNLTGYEAYVVYSLPLAFILYLVFTVFGAFAEEVAYRGYVQTRVSSRFGYILGIFVATLFFSLQHIHIFQPNWIVEFFQTQFVHVMFFGIFIGYLFFKSRENIWSVFAFHAVINIFSVTIPIVVTAAFPFVNQLVTAASFILIIAILRVIKI
ncbi:MAG: type II CAAX endopeptidase family protein [Candidatus Hermodarchaeota archaeon]|nr:type II CAAX endopeptidase family protein [Candidatus Hermodarchaeota archaeon]